VGCMHAEFRGDLIQPHLRGIATDQMAQMLIDRNADRVSYFERSELYDLEDARPIVAQLTEWVQYCLQFRWQQSPLWNELLGAYVVDDHCRGIPPECRSQVSDWLGSLSPFDLMVTYGARIRRGTNDLDLRLHRGDSY